MTKDEIKFIIDFLMTVTAKMDNLITDIHFFSGRLLGKEIIKAEENTSCYNNKTVIQTFQISKKEDMKYKGIKIRKRKDDRWYARVPINPGYYKYIYGKTQELCLKNLKDYLKDYSSETTKTKNRITFSNFYQTWLETRKNLI